ncbi:MAG TPA: PaaI family thioesterase [Alphaproteobacteria bacterium]|nr:PaaI family thioesterase [Alphaproteobacteria bacterium]
MLTIEHANRILDENFAAWLLDLRPRVEAVEKMSARLRIPYSDRLVRVGGTICGQALMSLADTAMVIAVSAASGGFRPMTTVGQTISFMRPIANADVLAEARVLRLGKTLAFGEIELRAGDRDDLAAHVTTTYAILGPAPA